MRRYSILAEAIRSLKDSKRLRTKCSKFILNKKMENLLKFLKEAKYLDYKVHQESLKNNFKSRMYEITDTIIHNIKIYDHVMPLLKKSNQKIIRSLRPTSYDKLLISSKKGLSWEEDLQKNQGGKVVAIITI